VTDVYEAWELPRGNIVVCIHDKDRSHPEVVDDRSVNIAQARQLAAELNTGAWLADKPLDAPSMEWGDDWERRLLGILDRMHGPEEIWLQAA
jgi:hypothetical protein